MCFLIKQCPEDANKPLTCPFLVLSLTGSFRNHTVYNRQPCHSLSQAWCRHGPADHQPPALSQIRVEESPLPLPGDALLGLPTEGREIFQKMAKLPSSQLTSVPNLLYILSQNGCTCCLLPTTVPKPLPGASSLGFSLAGLCASKSHQKELG